MTTKLNIFVAAATAAMIGNTAFAQTTAFDNEGAAEDRFEDLQEDIADDADRDIDRFGNEGREIGTYGSVAFRGTATQDGDDDSVDAGVGLRYGFYDGVNGYDATLSGNYGADNGETTESDVLVGIDYRRDLTSRFFAYAQADGSFDFEAEDDGDFEQDIFLGFGAGYRIIDRRDLQWTIQAGPGYRFAEVVGEEDIEEAAYSVSSNYFNSLSETAFVTNDTDIIGSDSATVVTNDLALSVALADSLSLRTSLQTVYNDASDEDFGDAKNTLGVAVVYNFN